MEQVIQFILSLFTKAPATASVSKSKSGISARGLDMIKKHEALRLHAYLPTKNDVPTIGYGHTKGVYLGMVITEKQATQFLKEDCGWVEKVLSDCVKVPLNQNQYDALASFIFNVGGGAFKNSTLLKKLNSGDYRGAADQLPRWNKQKGIVLRGLTKRRAEERDLFLS